VQVMLSATASDPAARQLFLTSLRGGGPGAPVWLQLRFWQERRASDQSRHSAD